MEKESIEEREKREREKREKEAQAEAERKLKEEKAAGILQDQGPESGVVEVQSLRSSHSYIVYGVSCGNC